jgi:hypothetical protein
LKIKGKPISDGDHVVRHIKKRWMTNEDGNIVIIPQAFELSENDDGYLSAAWLEHCAGTVSEQLIAVLSCMRTTRKINGKEGLTVGNVGRIKACCSKFGKKIRVEHEPFDAHLAYTAIRQYQHDNAEMLLQLSMVDWADLTLVSDIET